MSEPRRKLQIRHSTSMECHSYLNNTVVGSIERHGHLPRVKVGNVHTSVDICTILLNRITTPQDILDLLDNPEDSVKERTYEEMFVWKRNQNAKKWYDVRRIAENKMPYLEASQVTNEMCHPGIRNPGLYVLRIYLSTSARVPEGLPVHFDDPVYPSHIYFVDPAKSKLGDIVNINIMDFRKPFVTEFKKEGGSCRNFCKPPLVCDIISEKCKKATRPVTYNDYRQYVYEGILEDLWESRKLSSRKPWDYSHLPGSVGFNAYATKYMKDHKIQETRFTIQCPESGSRPRPQAYQKTVSFLVHPETPIDRFLVVHRTGLGKTYTMILVLNNFYYDPRPKIVIFPNDKVRNNFYQELMKFPNKYRDYVLQKTGRRDATSVPLSDVIDILAMKGHLRQAGRPGYIAAPLRAFRYTIAGGSQVISSRGPSEPIFKIGYTGTNPYDNKIVLMDEFHNLIKPDEETKKFQDKLDRLKAALYKAQNSVIVGLTATPIVDHVDDMINIMRLVKGEKYKDAPTTEGFVSYFQSLPNTVFPKVDPANPVQVLPTVTAIPLQGLNLKVYDEKNKKLKGPKKWYKLLNYNSAGQYYGSSLKPTTKFYKLLKDNPTSATTKYDKVVKDVLDSPYKTLIIVHRENGFRILETLFALRTEGKKYQNTCSTKGKCWIALYDKPTRADEKLLEVFNSPENKQGDLIKVAMIDAKFYSEGVSFKDVRRLILADMPPTWAAYKQRIGRGIRFCGHNRLPPDQRSIMLSMYMGTHPSGKQTADQYYLDKISAERDVLENALNMMAQNAVDREILKPFINNSQRENQTALVNTRRVVRDLTDPGRYRTLLDRIATQRERQADYSILGYLKSWARMIMG